MWQVEAISPFLTRGILPAGGGRRAEEHSQPLLGPPFSRDEQLQIQQPVQLKAVGCVVTWHLAYPVLGLCETVLRVGGHSRAARGVRRARRGSSRTFQMLEAANVTSPKLWASAFIFALLGVLGTLVNFISQIAFCCVFP